MKTRHALIGWALAALAFAIMPVLLFAQENITIPANSPPLTLNIDLAAMAAIAAAVYAVGVFIKHATKLPNHWIPVLTWSMASVGYVAITDGWGDGKAWVTALLGSATATAAHEGVKSTMSAAKSVTSGSGTPLLLAFVLAGGTGGCLLTSCTTSNEQAVYTGLSIQDAMAEQAVQDWDMWLGAQRILIEQDYEKARALPEGSPERAAAIKAGDDRQAKWQAVEYKVITAVADYNKAVEQATIAVVAYYDAKKQLGLVEGADAQFDLAKAKLDAARAIVGITGRAVVQIITAYVPLTQPITQ